jgi:UDP-N-acetylmuramoyl-L-alanyl-D-glutamate--2,6-diaminopimelate ligase
MMLGELVAGVGSMNGAGSDVEIAGLAYDSRAVRSGTLFFCVPGFRSDGHDFAAQAVADGAVALVVERPLGAGVPEVLVPSVRAAMGPIASRFHGDPSASLRVVGITGTNGKTTTAFLVRALLQAAGEQTGLLGTVTSIVGGAEHAVERTTPEALDLQASLRAMLEGGDRACAMEVSSHALELERAGGIRFAAAVFTNLTQDHLDFHPSMEDYFLAKRLLFLPGEGPSPGVSVVNVGDPYGRRLAQEIEDARTFALDAPADYSATDLRCDATGCSFALHTPAGAHEVTLPMPGRFNVANAVGALAAVHALDFDLDTLLDALQRSVRVPGRFEPVDAGQDFAVLVDYAHTPDSLENVLRSARDIARGRVISVFGAGGDRDRGKRPLMGGISARFADITLVTSDNPRSEEPAEIVAEIVSGVPSGALSDGTVHVEVDRRAAIEQALSLAMPDDVVVIAGKGHEQGQEFADGRKQPFDDVTVARELLSAGTDAPTGTGE